MANIIRVLVLTAALAQAQPAAFDVVSIKPHPEPIAFSGGKTSGTLSTWTATTLIDLVVAAYNLKYYQVPESPKWANSEHYDISARAPGDSPPTKEELAQMIQALLAERFHLKVHREMKEIPVYALVVGKSGLKLKEPDMNSREGYTRASATVISIVTSHGTMQQLADQLSNTAGRPVLDKTGLSGIYAYKLDFSNPNNAAASDPDIASMPTAVQEQLGLRLEPQKAPVEILVIDSAEKPSAN